MNIRDVANGVVFTKLNFNMDSFEERLIFQKKMYLLQGLGTDLGYSYNWYIRGPYSPGLSKYAYSNYEMLSEADYSGYTLVGDTEKNINIVNELRNDNDEEEMSVGKWYELLASLLYLYHNHGSFMIKEFVSNAHLIASHGIQGKCSKKHADTLTRLVNTYKKIIMLSDIGFGILECFVIMAISIAVVYEGFKIFHGSATIGVLVAFIQYADFLVEPGRTLAALRVQGNKLIPSLNRIKNIYNSKNVNLKGYTPVFLNYDIEFEDVEFSYPDEKKVFYNTNIKLESGKTHIIFGASGQGKTTMINLITRLWDTSYGVIRIGGHPITEIQIDYLRKHIALVSQDNLFFNETIRNNLEEIDGQYTENQIYSALEKAGMLREILEMPQKINTELGDRGYKLSGGQRQRLAIARAILKNSPIVIFDEPTSALDERSENTVMETIKEMKGKTMLVITHRKNMVSVGDCIYEIKDNRIIRTQ